jgi:hypothetical protein
VENHCSLIAATKKPQAWTIPGCGFFTLVKPWADGYNLRPSQSDTPRTLAL